VEAFQRGLEAGNRGDKTTSVRGYLDPKEALEAVGLRE